MLWWVAIAALADDRAEPTEPPETITLPSAELAPLPSALDLATGATVEDAPGVDPAPPPAPVWAARTAIRPRVQVLLADTGLDRLHPVTLGLEVARRTWRTGPRPTWAGELHFEGDLPLGRTTGSYDAALGLRAERWLGPIGIQLGPEVIGSRFRWDGPTGAVLEPGLILVRGHRPLAPALGIGTRLALVADLGPVGVFVGGQPVWWLAGDRKRARDLPIAGVGDEQRAEAGVGVQLDKVQLRARWSRAWTASMPIDRAGVGFSVKLL